MGAPKQSQWGHGFAPFDFKAIIAGYDTGTLTQTSAPYVDTYKYFQGGTGGTLLLTLAITWTDSTRSTISSWTIN